MLASILVTSKNTVETSTAQFGQNISIISQGMSAGIGGDYPYPASENWQKAIGAFNCWVEIQATVKQGTNSLIYEAKVTIHAEDRYNFNPGDADIKTGIPDAENGVFELTGLAKQFNQRGEYTQQLKWETPTLPQQNNSNNNKISRNAGRQTDFSKKPTSRNPSKGIRNRPDKNPQKRQAGYRE